MTEPAYPIAEPSSSMSSKDHTGTGLLRLGFNGAFLGRSSFKKKRSSFLAFGGMTPKRDLAKRCGVGSMFPAPLVTLLGLHLFWGSVPEGPESQ